MLSDEKRMTVGQTTYKMRVKAKNDCEKKLVNPIERDSRVSSYRKSG